MYARISTFSLVLSAALAGCTSDLPQPQTAEDLRVLAIRADPPELLYDAPEDRTVSFSALVVDPRGGTVNYAWRFCPIESDPTCRDYGALRPQLDESQRQEMDPLVDDLAVGSADSPATGLVVPDGLSDGSGDAGSALAPYAIARFDLVLPASVASAAGGVYL